MKVSTEIDNNFGYEKITQLVDNIPKNYAAGRQYLKYQLRNFFIPKIIVDFRTDLHKMKIKHRIIDEYSPKRCFFD